MTCHHPFESPAAGAFTAPVKFDRVGDRFVRCECQHVEHDDYVYEIDMTALVRDWAVAGAPGADKPDAEAEGYGWPPADYLPWGETEKIIDGLVEDQGPWTLGAPTFAKPEYVVEPGLHGAVYLAGPMRGIGQFNFPAFHRAAEFLRSEGWGVFNPAEFDEHNGFDATGYDGTEDLTAIGFNLRESLGADLAFIAARADAVAVLPGWEDSRGARAEVATALALGLLVFDVWSGAEVTEIPGPERLRMVTLNNVQFDRVESVDGETFDLSGHVVTPPEYSINFEMEKPIDPAVMDLLLGVDPATGAAAVAERSETGEVRVTSATGGEKGVKPEQYQSIPAGAMRELAEHFAKGAAKYSDHNMRKGYPWSSSFSALNRHLWAFWGGEDVDPETGSKHIIAVGWHALVLATFMNEHRAYDDRYKPGNAS